MRGRGLTNIILAQPFFVIVLTEAVLRKYCISIFLFVSKPSFRFGSDIDVFRASNFNPVSCGKYVPLDLCSCCQAPILILHYCGKRKLWLLNNLKEEEKTMNGTKLDLWKIFSYRGSKKIKVDQVKKENQNLMNFVILQQDSGRLQVFKNDPKNVYPIKVNE